MTFRESYKYDRDESISGGYRKVGAATQRVVLNKNATGAVVIEASYTTGSNGAINKKTTLSVFDCMGVVILNTNLEYAGWPTLSSDNNVLVLTRTGGDLNYSIFIGGEEIKIPPLGLNLTISQNNKFIAFYENPTQSSLLSVFSVDEKKVVFEKTMDNKFDIQSGDILSDDGKGIVGKAGKFITISE